MQCMHLLLWANVNLLVRKWALQDGGLSEPGAFLQWQSEITMNPKSERYAELATAFETGTLQRQEHILPNAKKAARQKEQHQLRNRRGQLPPWNGGRRRLGYGKWRDGRDAIPESDLVVLGHCGSWREAMGQVLECGMNNGGRPPCSS
jgi:hypothetical protein